MQKKKANSINGGYISLARQIIESDIFYNKPSDWFKIWIYILLNVNHKDNKQFKRGSNFFRWSKEKEYLHGITKYQWHHFLDWARNNRMIVTQKATRGIIVKVLNYNKFQSSESYKKRYISQNKSDMINNNEINILYIELAKKLGNLILKRKPDFQIILKQKEKNYIDWANDIRLMIERDNRNLKRIEEIIDWCQEDYFWQDNILSTGKLRKQFDKLELEYLKANPMSMGSKGGIPKVVKEMEKDGWKHK